MTVVRSARAFLITVVSLFLFTTAASAYEAAATVALNIRTGPGTEYVVIDSLYAGEPVEVTQCAENNWCFIEHEGPDGWVSAKYLSTVRTQSTETIANLPANFAARIELNVRSGPGPTYGAVDTLYSGEVVKVTECASNGWCYIEHSGPNGWVSSNFLRPTQGANGSSLASDCSIRFVIGSDGPSLSIICGEGPFPPLPRARNQACFYTSPNFNGSSFCSREDRLNSLDATFNDRISSVKLFGTAQARLCTDRNLRGYCRTITGDISNLGRLIDNRASSLEVFTRDRPTRPRIISSGSIDLRRYEAANLDNGAIGGFGVDIWYQSTTPVRNYLTPRNGARLALGDRARKGYSGCSVETYSTAPIPLWTIPIGSYVCAKTDQGRFSEFRLSGFAGTTMELDYTTWEK